MVLYDITSVLKIDPILLAVIVIWSLIWQGIAMWISARKKHKIWFLVFLVIHLVGILEILYIFAFSKMSSGKTITRVESKPIRRRRRARRRR